MITDAGNSLPNDPPTGCLVSTSLSSINYSTIRNLNFNPNPYPNLTFKNLINCSLVHILLVPKVHENSPIFSCYRGWSTYKLSYWHQPCLQLFLELFYINHSPVPLYFSIYCPNSPGGAPKLDPNLLPVSADFARSISAPFGLPPIGLPPPDSDHAKRRVACQNAINHSVCFQA